jgi:spermidine/putrescine transport system permease protein
MILFFFLPLLLMLAVSFATRRTYGGVQWTLTLINYADAADPLYLRILAKSVVMAAATTVICLVLAFPFAYGVSRLPPRRQWIWLTFVMVPFWTNFLVRTYAWMFLLRTEGLFNTWLQALGIIRTPLELLYTDGAVLVGLVYGYLPFMILPLYAVLTRIDRSLIEAAHDLYASGWAVFRRILWPLAMPGVMAGSLLVFMPSLGAYLTPDLLGGARTMMIGNLIQHQFLVVRDWPLGSALAFMVMALVLVGVAITLRWSGTRDLAGRRS